MIQSSSSSTDTAGPAGASDKTVGRVSANLDGWMDVSPRLAEVPMKSTHGLPFVVVAITRTRISFTFYVAAIPFHTSNVSLSIDKSSMKGAHGFSF